MTTTTPPRTNSKTIGKRCSTFSKKNVVPYSVSIAPPSVSVVSPIDKLRVIIKSNYKLSFSYNVPYVNYNKLSFGNNKRLVNYNKIVSSN